MSTLHLPHVTFQTKPSLLLTVRMRNADVAGRPGNEANDHLCLPEEPQYLAYKPGVQGDSPIHGVEYETDDNWPLSHVDDHTVPCAICKTVRECVLMIPARMSCPNTWTLEYSGYLMTVYKGSGGRTSAEWVHKDTERVRGEAVDINVAFD